uniref:Enhancer of rudimentary homolog n=1 Tax=Spongospora subterranea TaxID=70186 RepID=A0A0H5R4C7_9EUKA|eukprot:CRZ08993.1 hypothetical protein [Spongospora subterranea]
MTMHTIILVEVTGGHRSYDQYPTVRGAMNGVCQLFEKKLKLQYPNKDQITYDIKDLNSYIDSLPDLVAMTLNERESVYVPRNKSWIKQEVLNHLKQQANE